MNLKLKLLLLNRNNDQGMALAFALSIGVIMMLAGTIMIVRSQTDQTHVQAQQSTAESVSAAEVGATRIFSLLNENRYLAMYPDCNSRDINGLCGDTGTTPVGLMPLMFLSLRFVKKAKQQMFGRLPLTKTGNPSILIIQNKENTDYCLTNMLTLELHLGRVN